MKKLIPIFVMMIAFGCQDQSTIQKTTLDASSLKSVVANNTDFNAIVSGFIDMKNAKTANFASLTPSTKTFMHTATLKYSSADEFNKNATVTDKNLFLSLTPFTASKNFINLVAFLNSRYRFNISDLSSLVNQEIKARTTVTSTKKPSAGLDEKNASISGCQETCDIGQINTIFSVYNFNIANGASDSMAWTYAQIAGSWYVTGCYDGCNNG